MIWFRFSLLLIAAVLFAEPVKSPSYNLSVCAIFNNEAKYLKEWIEYHRMIGVDHFYLYDNNSRDRFRSILNPYIKRGIVTLIPWPDFFETHSGQSEWLWSLSTMTSAYEHAIRVQAIHETKWLTLLNITDFLVPLNEENLSQLLDRYEEYPGVILSTHYYDSSKRDHLSKNKLIIESDTLTTSPKGVLFKTVEKTIFKPDQCASFTWLPLRYKFQKGQQAITLNAFEARVNEYRNRGYSSYQVNHHKLFIDHRTIPDEELKRILDQGYEIEDQEKEIHRFIPELKKKMGFGTDIH